MKLKRLKASAFAGLHDADITFNKPVSLFVGSNNQGKSSVRDAIAFGLTGKARALTKFKDVGNLKSNAGNGQFGVDLEYEDDSGAECEIHRTKSSISVGIDTRDILRYCLHPHEFIPLQARDRGRVLAEVLGGGMDEITKAAIAKHIGNVDETVLAQIKASNISVLNLDVFKAKVVELRREYKRDLSDLPKDPPLLGDFDLDQDYDPEPDKNAVQILAGRIAKGGELLAKVKKQNEVKAGIIDSTKGIENLEDEKVKVPRLPADFSAKDAQDALHFMTLVERSLKDTDAKTVKCCVCEGSRSRDKMAERMLALTSLADSAGKILQRHDHGKQHNADVEAKIASLNAELKRFNEQLDPVELPPNGETLLADLQKERDQKKANLAAYDRYAQAMAAHTDAAKRRDVLDGLIKETDRIDSALKDGGPVKSYIAQNGRKLPINEKLLKLWAMEALEWSDNGEISLNQVAIEYASDSEKYRAGCVMGLALADISGIRVAALDGFDILVPSNANAFFAAVRECKLQNVLVFASSEKQYSSEMCSDWLEIFEVKKGKVTRI